MFDPHDFLQHGWARLVAAIFTGGVIGGLINRARGWGGGWNSTNEPKWLVWMQVWVFSREVLAVFMGALLCIFGYMTGHDIFWCEVLFPITSGLWLMGVILGWGDYVDGLQIPNHEIPWIDKFVTNHFQPWLVSIGGWVAAKGKPVTGNAIAALAQDADFIDSFSFGLRDAYYIPLFISLWPLAHAWIALPIAFFWQDAIIYHLCRKYFTGDFVMRAEPSTGDLRTVFMLIAIAAG